MRCFSVVDLSEQFFMVILIVLSACSPGCWCSLAATGSRYVNVPVVHCNVLYTVLVCIEELLKLMYFMMEYGLQHHIEMSIKFPSFSFSVFSSVYHHDSCQAS